MDTRTRMIQAAVHALQHKGVAGMSFTEVLAESGAARGAIYHHFPGGKSELVAEAATRNGEDIRDHLAALPASDPVEVVEAFLSAIRPVVAASADGGGCAIAAVSVGDDRDDPHSVALRELAGTTFRSWTGALASRLTTAGMTQQDAADLATTLLALLEGAHVLCRAAGDLEPYERLARTALALVRTRHTPSRRSARSESGPRR